MGFVLTVTLALCLWIVDWAAGDAKPFDAFLLAVLVLLFACAARIAGPFLPGNRRR